MARKFRSLFSSRRLCQRVFMVDPKMVFLSRPSSSLIGGFNSGMRLRTKSEENLNKLNECMENMDDDVSKFFMECHQTDFREDPELFRLLSDYFTTSKGVSELCESLRKCLERAERDECLLIDETLSDFEKEKLGYGGLLDASFRKTIKDLRNFTEFYSSIDGECDSDFLSGDFLSKSQICHEELAKMIGKLEKTMKEIDKNLKRVRGQRAVVAVVIVAPMIAVMFVSKIIAGISGVFPLQTLTTFGASRWRKSTETLKRKKTAMTSMERGTMVALKEVERISRLVSRLETVERSIRVTAEFAVKKRSSVAVALGGMKKERKRLESTMVDLDRETGRCYEFAQFGRTMAREKIFEFLSHGEKTTK